MIRYLMSRPLTSLIFFFNDTATTEIYTLSLHDALPISFDREVPRSDVAQHTLRLADDLRLGASVNMRDRKSTRLNSSHSQISYAVFCLKKKKNHPILYLYMYTPRVFYTPTSTDTPLHKV